MSSVSRYRLLLSAYPRAYRDARGEEMLSVLLATEERRGRWSVLPEAASLVTHGLALRIRQSYPARTERAFVGIAGVGLLLLLAVLGAHQLAAMGLRGLRLDGYPEAWQAGRVWVDPRWPIQVTWLATGVALLLRWHRTALALVWTATLLHSWWAFVEVTPTLALPWFGDLGPAWDAWFNAEQVSWLLLTWLGATLVGGPSRLARALGSVPARSWTWVLLAGIIASTVAFLTAPVFFWLTGPDVRLSESVRDAAVFALLASSMALVSALRRTPGGRHAILLLVLVALVLLGTRWNAPSPLPGAVLGAAVFAAGYAFGTHRRDPARQRR